MSAILARVLRVLVQRAPFERLVHAPTAFALLAVLGVGLAGNLALGERMSRAGTSDDVAEAGDQVGNVLFLVVDTLRADHLPMYGYENGSTPNLDRFAEDAIRFDQAFTNSSWTRPSFASILTGRLPSSHGVMAKSDALPDAVTTLPEALKTAGYTTAGYATNFNVAPYFNFHQGFDEYIFLEPEFVLGADDASAKLLLMQFIRQRIEKMRAMQGEVLPGTAYQDAETVNAALTSWIDRKPAAPWFMFVGYMDPHDPYFCPSLRWQRIRPRRAPTPRPLRSPCAHRVVRRRDQLLGRRARQAPRRAPRARALRRPHDHRDERSWRGVQRPRRVLARHHALRRAGSCSVAREASASRRGGTVVRHWVQSIDLMPTVLKLFEAPVPEGVQGGDLFTGTDVVYAEESHEGNVLESVRELDGTDEYKLINANRDNPRGLEARRALPRRPRSR